MSALASDNMKISQSTLLNMSIRISKRMLNMSIRMGEGMWMRRGLSGWRHECMGSGWPSLHASVAPGETPTSATIGLLRN